MSTRRTSKRGRAEIVSVDDAQVDALQTVQGVRKQQYGRCNYINCTSKSCGTLSASPISLMLHLLVHKQPGELTTTAGQKIMRKGHAEDYVTASKIQTNAELKEYFSFAEYPSLLPSDVEYVLNATLSPSQVFLLKHI